MTRRVYKDGVWTVFDDPQPRSDGHDIAERAPVAALQEQPERPLEHEKLPFRKIFNGHLIIQLDPYKRPRGARITLPDSAKRSSTTGRVLALADDITDVIIGDRILISQYAGYLLVFEGLPPMRVIGREEVLALMKDITPELIMESV